MIDRRYIGHAMPPFEVAVEAGRLRFFAQATGQGDPVYTDEAAARAAGHPGLPVPPTFLFCLEMEGPDPAAIRTLLELDYRRLLHGEQGFTYHRLAHAGERLRFAQRIEDIYAKKGGALEFVVRSTRVTGADGEPVADLRSVTVLRHEGGGSRENVPAAAELPASRPETLPERRVAEHQPAALANPASSLAPEPAAFAGPGSSGGSDTTRPRVGDTLPPLDLPPLSRHALALYCGASGDHNPIHVDIDFARAAGQADVFAHGMLSMAWLGRLLTGWRPQAALRELQVRFAAVTRVGETIRCGGEVIEIFQAGGEHRARLAVHTASLAGEVKLQGQAVVALPGGSRNP